MAINREIKTQKDFLTWLSKGKELFIFDDTFYGNEFFARKIDNLFIDKKFFTIKFGLNMPRQYERVIRIEECEPIKIKRSVVKAKKLVSDNYVCYVDSRYLDYFDDECYLEIAGEFDAIKVCEKGCVIGIIFPFIMKG